MEAGEQQAQGRQTNHDETSRGLARPPACSQRRRFTARNRLYQVPDVVDVNLGRNQEDAGKFGKLFFQFAHLLNDEDLVDSTDAADGDSLLLTQHGGRHGEHREEQKPPAW